MAHAKAQRRKGGESRKEILRGSRDPDGPIGFLLPFCAFAPLRELFLLRTVP
jgi:hypothetical protein